jgi:hypothetical protein
MDSCRLLRSREEDYLSQLDDKSCDLGFQDSWQGLKYHRQSNKAIDVHPKSMELSTSALCNRVKHFCEDLADSRDSSSVCSQHF